MVFCEFITCLSQVVNKRAAAEVFTGATTNKLETMIEVNLSLDVSEGYFVTIES